MLLYRNHSCFAPQLQLFCTAKDGIAVSMAQKSQPHSTTFFSLLPFIFGEIVVSLHTNCESFEIMMTGREKENGM